MLARRLAALMVALVALLGLLMSDCWAQGQDDAAGAALLVTQGIKILRQAPSVNNYKDAVEAFRKAVAADGTYSTAHFYLGVSLYQLASEMLLEDPLATDAAYPHLDESLAELGKAVELAPSAAGPRLYVARIRLIQGKVDEANKAVTDEIAVAPESARPEAYEVLGRVRSAQGRLVEAMQAYEWALDHDSRFAWALYSKAELLFRLKRYDECMKLCDHINTLLSEYARDADYLATLKSKGRRSAAQAQDTREKLLEKYSRVAEFKEDNMWPNVYRLQGQCYHVNDLFTQARACYLAAMSGRHDGNEKDLELRTLLASEYLAQANWSIRIEGRVTDPLKMLKALDTKVGEILKDNANYPPALELRGETYLLEAQAYKQSGQDNQVHQLEDARKAFEEAVKAYRDARAGAAPFPEARSGARFARCLSLNGYVLALLGRYDEALALYDEALTPDVDPVSWEAKVYRAFTLAESAPVASADAVKTLVATAVAESGGAIEAANTGGEAIMLVGLAKMQKARSAATVDEALLNEGSGAVREAVVLFREVAVASPKDARSKIRLADCYYELAELSMARMTYEDALVLIPPSTAVSIADDRSRVLLRLAETYFASRMYEPTIQKANEALASASDLWRAKELLGDAYTALRRYIAADEAYAAAFDLLAGEDSPDTARIMASHGRLFMTMGRDQEAELYLLRAISMFQGLESGGLTAEQWACLSRAQEDIQVVRERLAAGPSA